MCAFKGELTNVFLGANAPLGPASSEGLCVCLYVCMSVCMSVCMPALPLFESDVSFEFLYIWCSSSIFERIYNAQSRRAESRLEYEYKTWIGRNNKINSFCKYRTGWLSIFLLNWIFCFHFFVTKMNRPMLPFFMFTFSRHLISNFYHI